MPSDYEIEQLAKLKLVIEAALQNGACGDSVRISTTGHEPHAAVTIKGYVLAKLVREAPRE